MSDKAAQEPPKPSIWPLVAMMMLTLWMCNRPADPKHHLEQCGAHLHKIGVDLEKYRLTSDDGLYPAKLEEAYGQNPLPACPSGGKNTYQEGYKPAADRRSYQLVCKGDHHTKAGVPSDYPRIAFGPAEQTPHRKESEPSGSPSPQATASPLATPSPQDSPSPHLSASPQAPISPQATPGQEKSPQQGEPKKAGPSPSPQAGTAHP